MEQFDVMRVQVSLSDDAAAMTALFQDVVEGEFTRGERKFVAYLSGRLVEVLLRVLSRRITKLGEASKQN